MCETQQERSVVCTAATSESRHHLHVRHTHSRSDAFPAGLVLPQLLQELSRLCALLQFFVLRPGIVSYTGHARADRYN